MTRTLRQYTCEHCGRIFSTTATHARFCSKDCKYGYENEQRRKTNYGQWWNRRRHVLWHDPDGTLRRGALFSQEDIRIGLKDDAFLPGTQFVTVTSDKRATKILEVAKNGAKTFLELVDFDNVPGVSKGEVIG